MIIEKNPITQENIDIVITSICKIKELNIKLDINDIENIEKYLNDKIEYHDFITYLDNKVNQDTTQKDKCFDCGYFIDSCNCAEQFGAFHEARGIELETEEMNQEDNKEDNK